MRLSIAAFMSSTRSSNLWFVGRDWASLGISEGAPVKQPNVAADGRSLGNTMLNGEAPVARCFWVF